MLSFGVPVPARPRRADREALRRYLRVSLSATLRLSRPRGPKRWGRGGLQARGARGANRARARVRAAPVRVRAALPAPPPPPAGPPPRCALPHALSAHARSSPAPLPVPSPSPPPPPAGPGFASGRRGDERGLRPSAASAGPRALSRRPAAASWLRSGLRSRRRCPGRRRAGVRGGAAGGPPSRAACGGALFALRGRGPGRRSAADCRRFPDVVELAREGRSGGRSAPAAVGPRRGACGVSRALEPTQPSSPAGAQAEAASRRARRSPSWWLSGAAGGPAGPGGGEPACGTGLPPAAPRREGGARVSAREWKGGSCLRVRLARFSQRRLRLERLGSLRARGWEGPTGLQTSRRRRWPAGGAPSPGRGSSALTRAAGKREAWWRPRAPGRRGRRGCLFPVPCFSLKSG